MKKIVFLIWFVFFTVQFNSVSYTQPREETVTKPPGIKVYFLNNFGFAYKFGGNAGFTFAIQGELGVYGYASHGKYNSNSSSTDDKSFYFTKKDNELDVISVKFFPVLLFPVYTIQPLQIYTGIGPRFSYSVRKYDHTFDQTGSYNSLQTDKDKESTYDIGIACLAGVELMLLEQFSFFFESHLEGVKFWNRYERDGKDNDQGQESKDDSDYNTTGYFFNLSYFKLGLNFYF